MSHAAPPVRPIDLRLPSPLEELHDGRLASAGVRLYLKRDDLISPDIPGNKWRKLKYNLAAARSQGHRALLTFGGAYSNHIRATAAAGYYWGFATVGVIRGEEHRPLNPCLDYAVRHGMRLAYGLGPGQRALGFSVLKGGQFLARDVAGLQRAAFGASPPNWSIEHGFHFGGFAKRTPALGQFIAGFEDRHALALDWVYTAKMMYGIFALAAQGAFAPGTSIVAVITG